MADAQVANPGCFSADFTFYTYAPAADPPARLEGCDPATAIQNL